MTKFAVIGPGAVGCTIAYELKKSFSTVSLLGRQHKTINYYPGDNNVAQPLNVTPLTEAKGKVDVVFVAVKTYQLDSVMPHIQRICSSNTLVILAQNGYVNTDSLQLPHIYQAVDYISGQKQHDNVLHYRDEILHIQKDSHTQALARQLQHTPLTLVLEDDITTKIWYKLLVNLGINTVTALTQTPAKVLQTEEAKQLCRDLLLEGVQVAKAEGIQLPQTIVDDIFSIYNGYPDEMGTSMYYDYLHSRPIEVEAIQGFIFHKGIKHNLAIPTIRTTYKLLHTYQQHVKL